MPELLFVYNADSGLVNGLLDTLHKTLSPATYACSLCAVTYGAATMRPEWHVFIQHLPAHTTFLHRNELLQQHPELRSYPLPAIFRRATAEQPWQLAASAQELHPLDLPALMDLVAQHA